MRRRSRAGGEPAKTRRHKTAARKRGDAPKAMRNRGVSIAGQETVVARLTRERDEALLRETANAEILRLISKSSGDLELVFRTILEHATRICNANFGNLFRFDGENFYPVAQFNTPAALLKALTRRGPFKPTPGIPLDQVMRTKQVFHSADMAAEPVPGLATKLGGARTQVTVPMLKDDALIGAILIYRQEVQPFTDKQIALLQNFAAQAVIAIENTRLLNELRQRTTDLTESLEQQTATSEVLRAISSSPGELEPVFSAMLANAIRICEATSGHLWLLEGNTVRTVAILHSAQSYIDYRRRNPVYSLRDNPGIPIDRLANTKQVVHVPDLRTDQSYIGKNDRMVTLVEVAGARTYVAVPMLKEGELIGGISLYRQEVRPFTEKQIELVQNFAAQAVIAIENTRLLNELRQRTDDLTESLEQQTATSEVLRVISSSPGELEPVFNAMLENATRISEAKFGNLWLREGDRFRIAATHGAPTAYSEYLRSEPVAHPDPESAMGRIAATHKVVQIDDITAAPTYGSRMRTATIELAKARTLIGVPMLKETELIGIIGIYRQEVRPFTDKQIDLVKNFAAQAVIAIENSRLVNELRQRTSDLGDSLEQQTATSEILASMSGSMTETKPVFDAILRNLLRLFGTRYATVQLLQDGMIQLAALDGETGFERLAANYPMPLDESTMAGRSMLLKEVIQFAPVIDNSAAPPASARFAREFNYNSMLSAPMIRGEKVIGAIVTARRHPIAFDDKQVALIKSFAAQAVIAIENTRLLNELRQRTADLSESLEQQTATSEVLKVISSSPGDLQAVFSAMLESAARLCDASFGNIFRWDDDALRLVATYNTPAAFAEARSQLPLRRDQNNPIAEMLAAKTVLHVDDLAADERYTNKRDPNIIAAVELGGIRTCLAAPMLKDDELIGALIVYRKEVRPFSDKQIALVQNFANQAVIAIENTRLLNELRQSLQQQTATADVLKVISRSTFDLQTVLDTLGPVFS